MIAQKGVGHPAIVPTGMVRSAMIYLAPHRMNAWFTMDDGQKPLGVLGLV